MKKIISLALTIMLLVTTLIIPQGANANETEKANGNPVLEGSYSDPDIDYFDHKYWIFPTTDGIINETGWWGGKSFSAFSSEDMVNWKNEGVILNVEADNEEEAGVNENGVQIAFSKWSYAHAWAPSIEKIGDKYFFFYVGSVKEEYMSKYCVWLEEENRYLDDKAIGVAVADSPTGPYVAYDEPLLYGIQAKQAVDNYNAKQGTEYTVPSVIDPSVFVDEGVDANRDGKDDIYITFGNWTPMIVRVNVEGDKISIDNSVFKPVKGVLFGWWQPDDNGFMESLIIFKRNGKYYFTWSVDGTASIGYRVAYGVTNKITNEVEYKGTMLQLDRSKNIFGTAHQSILHNPIDNKYYIAYHRLQVNKENGLQVLPDGTLVESGDQGNFRETCIDEIKFDALGNASVEPTHEGVAPVSVHEFECISSSNPTCTSKGVTELKCKQCGKVETEYTNAKGHSYTATVIKPTCAKQGYTKHTCSVCKKTYNSNYVKATGKHSYGTGKVTKKPTSTSTGTMTYTCKVCGGKKTSTISKLAKASISKLTAKSKGFTASWKKVASATGYQLQFSTSSKFSNAKIITITKNSTLSKSVTKLKAKKKYYVRIRTYRTINGVKYYSSWSVHKTITTKK